MAKEADRVFCHPLSSILYPRIQAVTCRGPRLARGFIARASTIRTMSDQPIPTPPPRRRRTNPVVLFLMAFIPVACAAAVLYYVQIRKPQTENKRLNSELIYKTVGLKDAAPITLDARFSDADGDLVADPPANAKDQIDPPTVM